MTKTTLKEYSEKLDYPIKLKLDACHFDGFDWI